MYSVEQVAERLGLHVRTVRNYVRDGRLKAVRIGKQYRIAPEDLEAFTGRPEPPAERARHVEVSTIVEVDAISPDEANRLSTTLLASLTNPREGDPLGRVQTVYDRERQRMKIIIIGGLSTGVTVLKLIGVLLGEDE